MPTAPTLLAKSQQVAAAEASSLTKTGHTPAVGTTYLVVAVGWGRNATRTITSVTYGGVAMSLLAGINDNSGGSTFCGVAFYGLASPASSGDIVLTMSDLCDGLVIWALDCKDVNATPVATSNTGAASGTAAKSLSMTTSAATLMLGMRSVSRVTSSYTPGTGVTEEYDLQHGPGGIATYFLGSRNSTGGETFSFGCTVGATANGDAMAVLALAGTLNNYSIAADQGSYSLAGQAANLRAARTIAAAQGSYSLAGQAANLRAARAIAAAQGSYALSGQAVTLTYTAVARLLANTGFYSLSGQPVTLLFDGTTYKLQVAAGLYNLAGQSVDLLYASLLLPQLKSCWSPQNALREATVSASSEAAGLPLSNAVIDPHGGTVWRALDSEAVVSASWAIARPLRAFALAHTSLSAQARVRLRLSNVALGDSEVWDSGWLACDIVAGFDQSVLVTEEAYEARFLEMEIVDPGNSSGWFDVGFVWAGDAFETAFNPSWNAAIGHDDPSAGRGSIAGQSYTVRRRTVRLANGFYELLPEAQAQAELLDLARTGTQDNVLFVPQPGIRDRNREAVIGLLQKSHRLPVTAFGRRAWDFEIRERL